MNRNLGRQWTPPTSVRTPEYPKSRTGQAQPERAAQRLQRIGPYDPVLDAKRKGITPNSN